MYNLIPVKVKCPECGSTTAHFRVTAMTKVINFHICSKKGCTWHGLSETDYHDIMVESSKEW